MGKIVGIEAPGQLSFDGLFAGNGLTGSNANGVNAPI